MGKPKATTSSEAAFQPITELEVDVEDRLCS